MSQIYTITEIVTAIVRHYSGLFSFVWVQGEVSNCSYSSTGTLYFSLKEGNILLDCVWFVSKQNDALYFDVLTGEVQEEPQVCLSKTIKNGDYIYVAGTIGIYKERSKYQLYVELAQYVREGNISIECDAIKARLASEGLFDARYKKALPRNPERVAIITSKESAALQDFLHVATQCGIGGYITVYDSLMQGNKAVEEICHAISMANENMQEVIVLIRGGGAKEEIELFNNEMIVRAIFASHVPIITGIGHEIDETLADLVADATGITPTFVAHMLFENRKSIQDRYSSMLGILYATMHGVIYRYATMMQKTTIHMSMMIATCLESAQRRYTVLQQQCYILSEKRLQKAIQQYIGISSRYKGLHSYITHRRVSHNLESYIQYLYKNMLISYRDSHIVYHMQKKRFERYQFFAILSKVCGQLEQLLQRMHVAMENHLMNIGIYLEQYVAMLHLLSPERIMSQGYICVETIQGERITRSSMLSTSLLRLHFNDGYVCAQVVSKE